MRDHGLWLWIDTRHLFRLRYQSRCTLVFSSRTVMRLTAWVNSAPHLAWVSCILTHCSLGKIAMMRRCINFHMAGKMITDMNLFINVPNFNYFQLISDTLNISINLSPFTAWLTDKINHKYWIIFGLRQHWQNWWIFDSIALPIPKVLSLLHFPFWNK